MKMPSKKWLLSFLLVLLLVAAGCSSDSPETTLPENVESAETTTVETADEAVVESEVEAEAVVESAAEANPQAEVVEKAQPEPVEENVEEVVDIVPELTAADLDMAFSGLLGGMVRYNTLGLADANLALTEDPAPFILDVRTPAEAEEKGHIEGTVLIPLEELGQNLDQLPVSILLLSPTAAAAGGPPLP
jgi:hypothetical protein